MIMCFIGGLRWEHAFPQQLVYMMENSFYYTGIHVARHFKFSVE